MPGYDYELYHQHIENLMLYLQVIEILQIIETNNLDLEPKHLEMVQNLIFKYQTSLFKILIILFWYFNIILSACLFVFQSKLFYNENEADRKFFAVSFMVLFSTFSVIISIYLVNTHIGTPIQEIFTAYPLDKMFKMFFEDDRIYLELKWILANLKTKYFKNASKN